jgi:hypothetical protein
MPRYQTDETTFSRMFIKEITEDADAFEKSKKAFMLAGTVVRIFKSNEMICSFMLEDFTRAQVVESFSDKLPIDFVLELGDILEIKGNLVQNKFGERVVRLLKVRKVTLNEEMVHYLEILNAKKQKLSQGLSEEGILTNDADIATQTKIPMQQNPENIKKKLSSVIFTFAMKNYEKFKDVQGVMARAQLLALAEITAIKAKIGDTLPFEKLFEEVLLTLESSELIVFMKKDLVLNLEFFENFDDNFLYILDQEPEVEFSYKTLYIIFNNMIHENFNNMINKECVYEYINKLIFRKKLTAVENKKETFRKI